MTSNQFDRISKLFAERRVSRRRVLAAGGASVVATGLGTTLAQDATPAPETSAVPVNDDSEMVQYLFVQSYASGSIAATGEPGRYTVTLEGGAGQTVYFADRPSRDVGAEPTEQFLEGLGFTEENPPNAAIVMELEPGDVDIAVVELFDPTVDPETNTVTYDITPLANWDQSLEMGFQEAPTDLADLIPEFGAAHLFIDDCADQLVTCVQMDTKYRRPLGQRGMCWNKTIGCSMCDAGRYQKECNQTFPDFCKERCDVDSPCEGALQFCF